MKFLAITASNLDEFVEVRQAGLLQQVEQGRGEAGPDGLTPERCSTQLSAAIHHFVKDQYACWREKLVPALAAESIHVRSVRELKPRGAKNGGKVLFRASGAAADPGHGRSGAPVSARLEQGAVPGVSVAAPPQSLANLPGRRDRAARASPPSASAGRGREAIEFAFLHDIVHAYAGRLYHGYQILSAAPFRVTRNSNLYLREEESRSILDSVDTQLHRRRKGAAVRLEIEAGADPEIIERLRSNFGLAAWQVFQVHGPINLSRLFNLYEQTPRPDLKFRPFVPRELEVKPEPPALFDLLRERDVLLHHPYDSYSSVVRFIESAAQDPDVLSIKQTLYRTSEDSPIVRALMEAAAKKEVTVVVELKARFDEASNIRWARSLQEAGVQVYYGLVGLKTHCKLACWFAATRTGNRAATRIWERATTIPRRRAFTPISACSPRIPKLREAVHYVFNYLTAYSERVQFGPLSVAPSIWEKTA